MTLEAFYERVRSSGAQVSEPHLRDLLTEALEAVSQASGAPRYRVVFDGPATATLPTPARHVLTPSTNADVVVDPADPTLLTSDAAADVLVEAFPPVVPTDAVADAGWEVPFGEAPLLYVRSELAAPGDDRLGAALWQRYRLAVQRLTREIRRGDTAPDYSVLPDDAIWGQPTEPTAPPVVTVSGGDPLTDAQMAALLAVIATPPPAP